MTDQGSLSPSGRPRKLNRNEARESLPEELRNTFDKLCEETLLWSQHYYGASFISYSILKELVKDGWQKIEPTAKID
jgi:hypothetical protein